MIRRTTQIFSIMSARLKIGKLKIPILIKSLTHPYIILSIKLPTVPAIKNAIGSRQSFFLANNRIKSAIPIILIIIVMISGTGNDREIPLFNIGRIHVVLFR